MATIATRRAVGYARVSTPGQAGERHASLEEQQVAIERYCQQHGLDLVETFVDTASGRRTDRREYQSMLRFIAAGGIDAVIVRWIDRFGRLPKETLRRYWQLEEAGVTVECSDEDIKDELSLMMRTAFAGHESRRNAERTMQNRISAAKRGVHFGSSPFGFRRVVAVAEDGHTVDVHLEVDETEAAIVREMVELLVDQNWGTRRIADHLNAQGIRTRKGVLWASDNVRFVLSNPALNGTNRYGRKSKMETLLTPNTLPKVLSDEQWSALRGRMSLRHETSHGHAQTSRYLLTSVLKCGFCRGSMTGRQGRPYVDVSGQPRIYPSYWCGNWTRSRAICAHPNGISERKLHPAVFAELRKYVDPAAVRALLAPPVSPLPALAAQMKRLQRQLEKTEALFFRDRDRLDRGVFDERDFAQSNADRRALQEELQHELDAIRPRFLEAYVVERAEQLIPRQVEDVLAQIEHGQLPVLQAKALLQALVKVIYVSKDAAGRIKLELEFRLDTEAAAA